jgi:hypothetical protein
MPPETESQTLTSCWSLMDGVGTVVTFFFEKLKILTFFFIKLKFKDNKWKNGWEGGVGEKH